jgi:hypothetical protein
LCILKAPTDLTNQSSWAVGDRAMQAVSWQLPTREQGRKEQQTKAGVAWESGTNLGAIELN